ncbi:MAG: hypothetical protein KGJ12_02495 [Gammaproteobacteria bacterium]|nr:hypothetical protein [Gammaproteobacteria bacterium]
MMIRTRVATRKWLFALACALLGALVLALYYPGTHGPYVLDDVHVLAANPKLKLTRLSLHGLYEAAFSEHTGPLYRPVAMVSFALDYYFAGNGNAWSIKLTNILIHIATAWGVFLLSLCLLGRLQAQTVKDGRTLIVDERTRWVALFIAALWALHPLQVSTVLYAVQRMTELAALFCVYGAVAYIKGRVQLLEGRPSGFWWVFGGAALGGALATLSKENGALLPLLLLVIEGIFFRFRFHPTLKPFYRYAVIGGLVVPTLALFGYLAYLVILQPHGSPLRPYTLAQRLLTESRVMFFYLRLILLPDIRLMGLFHDDFPLSRNWLHPATTLPSVIGVCALLAAGLYGARKGRYPVLSFAILWFLGGQLLESSVVPLELVFEHRNYLPDVGPLFAAGYYFTHPRFLSPRVASPIRLALPLAVLVALASPLQQRVMHWSSERGFLLHEIEDHPKSPRAWASLGYALYPSGHYAEAYDAYQEAARLNPREAGYPLALLSVFYQMKKAPPAALVRETGQRLRDYPITAYTAAQLIASAKYGLGLKTDGVFHTVRLLSIAVANPLWPSARTRGVAYFLLGRAWLRHRQPQRAIQAWLQALKFLPREYSIHLDLARLYLALGDKTRAATQLTLLEKTPAMDASLRAQARDLRRRIKEWRAQPALPD